LQRKSPDGAFAGVVSGTLPLNHFPDLFERMDLGENGTVGLFYAEGTLVVRAPFDDEAGRSRQREHRRCELRAAWRGSPANAVRSGGLRAVPGEAQRPQPDRDRRSERLRCEVSPAANRGVL
jgi:hypothetical protein